MPTPRSILLHVDNTARAATRIHLAGQLADSFSATVTAQACLLPSMMRYPMSWDGASAAAEIMQAYDRDCLARMHTTFVRESRGSPRLNWAEPLQDGPAGFAARALCADLLLLGQPDPHDPAAGELAPGFLPEVLIRSGRPALVLPYTGPANPLGGTVLLAWKPVKEAARAVAAALPWMLQARRVQAVSWGNDAAGALERLAQWLGAHGIHPQRHDGGNEPADVGNALLSLAADVDADLLAMGGYGHSRAREWVMGGATRTVLGTMTLPVLMVH